MEVDQPLWEHKDLSFLNGLGNESIGGGTEPHIQLAFKHEQHLCSTRVGVGWVRPLGVKSMRERATPRVLSPGIFYTLTTITRDPMVLLVKPSFTNPSKKKSIAVMFVASLQLNPFTFTPNPPSNK